MSTGRLPDPNTAPVTAKGDLYTYSTVPAKLAVGNNGETLVADSSTSTGLRYQGSMAAGRNFAINGGFDFWQRGTSSTTSGVYLADRWIHGRAGGATGATYTRQTATDSSTLPFLQYSFRLQRDSGNTSTAQLNLNQVIETVNSLPLAGRTVTLSFYARVGANFSATSGTVVSYLITGTGTDQNGVLGAYTGAATALSTSFTGATTSWQRFQSTATLSNTTNEMYFGIGFNPVGTAGAADYLEIAGVQLELGSIATTFTRAGGTIAGELAACQRYYWRSTTSTQGSHGIGATQSTTSAIVGVNLPMTMRVVPTSIDYANLRLVNYGVAAYAISAITLSTTESTQNFLNIDCSGATGMTANRPVFLYGTGSSGYLGASAEL